MMLTAKELAAKVMEALEEGWRMTPEERFNEMVELGLIDREGRVSTQLGGDAETPLITSPDILAR
jgi:hypothetical protein